MDLKNIFRASAITTALVLAGCGGDINITEGNVTGDTTTINNPPAPTPTPNPTPTGPTIPSLPTGIPAGTKSPLEVNLGTDVSSSANFSAIASRTGKRVVMLKASAGAKGQKLDVKQNIWLHNDTIWVLDGITKIGGDNADSATLYIQEGTTVIGQSGSDALVISRGSKIEALGTASKPIILTSRQDAAGEQTAPGQWGGLVLLGNAKSNKCPTDGTPCAREVEGVTNSLYGGTNDEDSSGTLKYLIVKNSGFELQEGNELNGITFAGVGSGTTVDHIQVHNSSDDGVEFFGGTVDVKYLVLTNNQDDSIDWDHGYTGRMQHIYVQHNPNNSDANRLIEADNDGSKPEAEPKSNPTLSNMTAIGSDYAGKNPSEGVYLREGTGAQIYNMVVTGPSKMGECLEVEGNAVSQANLADGTIKIENSVMACRNGENFKNGKLPDGASHSIVDLKTWFLESGKNNQELSSVLMAADGQPLPGSPLIADGAGQDVSNTVNNWFDSTNYIGAFDGKTDWRSGWAYGFGGGEVPTSSTGGTTGCPSGTNSVSPVDGQTTTCQIPAGVLTSDLRLTSGNIYAINGVVFVGGDNDNNATLTIDPGVTLYGEGAGDALVVSRGSKIQANGTRSNPITMTSKQDVTGGVTAPGQWGGLVLLGNAKSNKCPTDGTPCSREVEGLTNTFYGGDNDTESSGTLRFLRVKHGGFELQEGNELNGITFAGVGSGTTVEYIQVHQNSDDGIEFFGGTVNLKFVVLTGNQDDSVDWDHGYTGKMQFVLVQQATNNTDANRLIEADNDGSNLNASPMSKPTIANFTGIGNTYNGKNPSEGVYLREGTGAIMRNFIISGPAGMGECLEVEGNAVSQANLANGNLVMTNSIMACDNGENFKNGKLPDGASHTIVDLQTWFNEQTGNSVAASGDVLNGIYTKTNASPFTFEDTSFFQQVTFVGAVTADNDWTEGWTVGLVK